VAITYERPSRASRALVIVSALVVVVLAAWVLTPILLTSYPSAFAAIPLLREVVAEGTAPDPRAVAPPGRELRESRDLAIDRPPEAREPVKPAVAAEPAPPSTEQQTSSIAAAPAAPPQPENESVATVATTVLPPWPAAESQAPPPLDDELVEETNTPPPGFGPVPVPPRRPDMAALARLGVTPLPRPRPAAAPSAEPDAVPDEQRRMFDRLSAPQ
jgi:hypothetical protein